MTAKTEEAKGLKLNLNKAHSVYLPALNILYKIKGGSLLFKLKIKQLCDEIEAKKFIALQPIREASKLVELAQTQQEKEEAGKNMQNLLNVFGDTEIEIKASKMPYSLLPSEEVLMSQYSEEIPLSNGETRKIDGDYITLVSDIYEALIEGDPTILEKL